MTDDSGSQPRKGYGLRVRIDLPNGGYTDLQLTDVTRDEVQDALDFFPDHFRARTPVAAAERSTAGGAA